jgi:hypothetical protein
LGLFWAGCFSFGLGSMIREVPYDPYCDYVFFGEEISMAARLWTSGYDFYHPTIMYVYHMWERQRPTFWQNINNDSKKFLEKRGTERLQKLLGVIYSDSSIVPPYGLGSVRTLQDYENFIGINMSKKQLLSMSGVLGLPNNASVSDILYRFGTWKNYKKLIEQ